MTKRIIAGVLALTLVMGSVALPSGVFENVAEKTGITASAYDTIESGDYKYGILDDGTIEIAEYTGSANTVVIPSSLDGKKVTSIGSCAFSGVFNDDKEEYESFVENVTIPDSILRLDDFAFLGCDKLTSIYISKNVESIGDKIFEFCRSLTNIDVDSSNENYSALNGILYNKNKTKLICCPEGIKNTKIEIPNGVKSIEYCAFGGCANIKNIIIPNSITFIGNNAFEGRYNEDTKKYETSLTSITIPNSVKSIGENAFLDCVNLKSVKMSNSITAIEEGLFHGCENLVSITLPKSVKLIEKNAFNNCSSLASITIPNGVTSIGYTAFIYCTSLTSITIPSSVTIIKDFAFVGCTRLKSLKISNGLKKNEACAFEGCTSLKNVTIPKSVTSIGEHALGYILNLKNCKYEKIAGFMMTVYYDSTAGVYARKNKFSCKYTNYIGNNKVKLSKTSYSYSGKANKPAVTIMCGKTKLKSGKDYTYTYKNNKAIGTASVVIKGKGKYNGTKTVTFKINPKKQTAKLTSYNDAFKASWTKDKQATGYQVKYAKAKSFKGSKTYTVNAKTMSKKIKGKNKTTYYVKVRTYKTIKGKTYCGAWSTVKTIKTK